MMSIEQIRDQLQDRNLRAVAARCGVNHITLGKIRMGKSIDIRYATLLKLSNYFEKKAG